MTEKYCPDWVFDATVSEVAMQFLLRDYPLSQIAQKHAQGLSTCVFFCLGLLSQVGESFDLYFIRMLENRLTSAVIRAKHASFHLAHGCR